MVIKLSSIDQFKQIIEENKYIFVSKYSKACPISANTYDQFNKSSYEHDIGSYYLIVQREHNLSDYIAKKTDVKHESPQAFYSVNGGMVWNRDRDDINVSSLAQAEG